MSVAVSLFDRTDDSTFAAAGNWITELLGGPAATSLCIIAVAMLGMLMLSGRMPVRRGLQVVLGCFLLLGASALAEGLRGLSGDLAGGGGEPVPLVIENDVPPPPLPPADYDPYAGASLRRR